MNNVDLEKTGQFLPVDEYIDLTNRGSLPDDPERGYRVLTKETLDYYGLFYDKNEMERIAELLEGTGWRIPTEEDWNDMLNSLECLEQRNHSNEPIGEYLGRDAGKILKSPDVWVDDIESEGITQFDFEILPTDGNFARFWTNTKYPLSDNYYIKTFASESSGVKNEISSDPYLASIRLVKDYDGSNYIQYEKILGQYYKTTKIDSLHEDEVEYSKIWTSINLNYTDENVTGAVEDSWEFEKVSYMINEWDGEVWHKKLLSNGCKVVLLDGDSYIEYIVLGDQLLDINDETTRNILELSGITEYLTSEYSGYQANNNTKITLKKKINKFFGNGAADLLKEYILEVLEGIDGEITLKRENGKIYFGFDDDAIFGPK